jgi:hypothetical protein
MGLPVRCGRGYARRVTSRSLCDAHRASGTWLRPKAGTAGPPHGFLKLPEELETDCTPVPDIARARASVHRVWWPVCTRTTTLSAAWCGGREAPQPERCKQARSAWRCSRTRPQAVPMAPCTALLPTSLTQTLRQIARTPSRDNRTRARDGMDEPTRPVLSTVVLPRLQADPPEAACVAIDSAAPARHTHREGGASGRCQLRGTHRQVFEAPRKAAPAARREDAGRSNRPREGAGPRASRRCGGNATVPSTRTSASWPTPSGDRPSCAGSPPLTGDGCFVTSLSSEQPVGARGLGPEEARGWASVDAPAHLSRRPCMVRTVLAGRGTRVGTQMAPGGSDSYTEAAHAAHAIWAAGEVPPDVRCSNHFNLPATLFLRCAPLPNPSSAAPVAPPAGACMYMNDRTGD